MKTKLLTIGLLIIVLSVLKAQSNSVITGKVYNQSKQPIPGVSVAEKGTNNKVVADDKGKYTLTVKNQSAILIFSCAGFETQELAVKNKRVLDVILQSPLLLESEYLIMDCEEYSPYSQKEYTIRSAPSAPMVQQNHHSKYLHQPNVTPTEEYASVN